MSNDNESTSLRGMEARETPRGERYITHGSTMILQEDAGSPKDVLWSDNLHMLNRDEVERLVGILQSWLSGSRLGEDMINNKPAESAGMER